MTNQKQAQANTVVWKTEVTVIGKHKTVISVEGDIEKDGDAESVMSEALDAYRKLYPPGTDAIIKPSGRPA